MELGNRLGCNSALPRRVDGYLPLLLARAEHHAHGRTHLGSSSFCACLAWGSAAAGEHPPQAFYKAFLPPNNAASATWRSLRGEAAAEGRQWGVGAAPLGMNSCNKYLSIHLKHLGLWKGGYCMGWGWSHASSQGWRQGWELGRLQEIHSIMNQILKNVTEEN